MTFATAYGLDSPLVGPMLNLPQVFCLCRFCDVAKVDMIHMQDLAKFGYKFKYGNKNKNKNKN